MTDIERRALLGDKQAQEECTEKGIVLPCWRCGGEAEVNELPIGGKPLYAVACKKHYCGAYGAGNRSAAKALEDWNTRPAPPIGRCGECKEYDTDNCLDGCGWCRVWDIGRFDDGFCDKFKSKERE